MATTSCSAPRLLAPPSPGPACTECGGLERYRITRAVDGEWVHVDLCRTCNSGTPLVSALDRVVDDAFSE